MIEIAHDLSTEVVRRAECGPVVKDEPAGERTHSSLGKRASGTQFRYMSERDGCRGAVRVHFFSCRLYEARPAALLVRRRLLRRDACDRPSM